MEYRIAIESDIAGMARIRALNRESLEHWIKRISGYLKLEHHPQQALIPRIAFVAVENNEIAGFIAGHLTRRFACEGELEWIDVISDSRRSGIATNLLQMLAGWFVDHNALKICVDCAPENKVAENFYKKNGAVRLSEYWLIWDDIRKVPDLKR